MFTAAAQSCGEAQHKLRKETQYAMRLAILILLAQLSVALLPTEAEAQPSDKLLIFSDEALTDSTLTDDTPRIVTFYIVQTEASLGTASGVRFRTVASEGFTGVWLGDATSNIAFGTSNTDIAVGYGGCKAPPIVVVAATYQLFGTSSACSGLSIAPAPGFLCAIALSDAGCFFEMCVVKLGAIQVNCPVATEPTTWGQVKALYRN
jgi:hypothetical protein